jgi:hypothetical protein
VHLRGQVLMRHQCSSGLVVKNRSTLRGAIVMVTVILVHIVQSLGDAKTTMTGTEGWMIADIDRMKGDIAPDEEVIRGRDRDRDRDQGHRRTGGLEANGTGDVRGHQIVVIEKSGGDYTRYACHWKLLAWIDLWPQHFTNVLFSLGIQRSLSLTIGTNAIRQVHYSVRIVFRHDDASMTFTLIQFIDSPSSVSTLSRYPVRNIVLNTVGRDVIGIIGSTAINERDAYQGLETRWWRY